MARLPITIVPNAILRTPTTPVDRTRQRDGTFQAFLDDLVETMQSADGVGIAATQVGSSERVCVVTTEAGPQIYINPTLHRRSLRTDVMEEGCLSIPGVYGTVRRHKHVWLKAIDRHGNPIAMRVQGFHARIVQHEVDHLDGKLFTDKVLRITRGDRPTET